MKTKKTSTENSTLYCKTKSILSLTFLIFVGLVWTSCAGRTTSAPQPTGGSNNGPKERTLSESEKEYLATTTLYYVAQFSAAQMKDCAENEKVNMKTQKEQLIARVCKSISDTCKMEGTCQLEIKNRKELIHVDGRSKTDQQYRFRNITNSPCRYGHGARRDSQKGYAVMCVDPYYSVAADLAIYNLGDVIFLPDVRGLQLPNGETHTGYFIVRDTGGNIKGKGRFDFFTGFQNSKNPDNPFVKIKLNGKQTFPRYFLIRGNDAQDILKERRFPLLK